MKLTGKKKLDDFLRLNEGQPEYDDLKRCIGKWRAFIASRTWRGPPDVRRDEPRGDFAAAPMIGFRLNLDWRINARIMDWCGEDKPGEIEVLWIGKPTSVVVWPNRN
jgi:hypothetical protein